MLPGVGEIVWQDGTTPLLIVGHGVDAANDNVEDGRLFAVELGTVTTLEPDEHGAYNFGAAPYVAGSNNRDVNDPQPAGGFGTDTPIVGRSTSSSDGAPLQPGAPGTTVGDPVVGADVANAGSAAPAGAALDMPPVSSGYTDNGDGTFTRTSDGAVGYFTADGTFTVKPGTTTR